MTSLAGRVVKIHAREGGGRDVVSANVYKVGGRLRLKPCEMPSSKVLDFLERAEPITGAPETTGS